MSLLEDKNKYWGDFYKNEDAPHDPSSFAVECGSIIRPSSKILEIGCGNCRDANYLANHHSVIAVDGNSHNSFASNKTFFIRSNIEDLVDIKCDYIYSRFFIHAIPEDVEDMFWDYVKRNSKNFLVEARSDKSSFEGDHYRRFINKSSLERKLSDLGFKCEIQESKGLAVLGDQDPFVVRIFGSVN
jgi:hypothetical protein